MTGCGCWKSEYDWEVSLRPKSQWRETVLCVLFDNEAQRQFSSVRITLLCGTDVTPKHIEAWVGRLPLYHPSRLVDHRIIQQVTPRSSSLSVVNRLSPDVQDTAATQNAPSLPVCNIAFIADRHSAHSQAFLEVTQVSGELVLSEAGSLEHVANTVFEFEQPLTENTQSVFVSFTSSYLLSTIMTRGVSQNRLSDHRATVGRVVRVLPVVPRNKRRTLSLPIEVLLIIFETLHSLSAYRNWRKDILSCALVCREWICALDVLLIDFRSEDGQQGHPPEIVSFANALVARPSLGLGIKHLSVHYLEKHPSWDPRSLLPQGDPSPMFLAKSQLRPGDLRRSHFANAFLSILRVASNLRTLCLHPVGSLVVQPDDLANALRGLSRLEILSSSCGLNMALTVSCITTWPSLRRLFILGAPTPSNDTFPLPSLSCCLTEIYLWDVSIKDDELACLVSTSGSTLERLTLGPISELTNAGLTAALNTVCTSLTYLHIVAKSLARDRGEEYPLDATIARMIRLTDLVISPNVASERMLERRAEAFTQRTMAPALPEVRLRLTFGGRDGGYELTGTTGCRWPGWKIADEWS